MEPSTKLEVLVLREIKMNPNKLPKEWSARIEQNGWKIRKHRFYHAGPLNINDGYSVSGEIK